MVAYQLRLCINTWLVVAKYKYFHLLGEIITRQMEMRWPFSWYHFQYCLRFLCPFQPTFPNIGAQSNANINNDSSEDEICFRV